MALVFHDPFSPALNVPPLLFQNVCAFTEPVTIAWTVTGPASLAHAGMALLGGSATSRPQPVGPTCSSATSMPPVNTAMGQRGRSGRGWGGAGTTLNGPWPLCYLQTDPTQVLRPGLSSCRCVLGERNLSLSWVQMAALPPLKVTRCVTWSKLLRLSETRFPHPYDKGDVAYLAGQLWTLEKPAVKAPSTRAPML